MKELTPGKAILAECLYCKGGSRFTCNSQICKLGQPGPSLKRIREYCIDCVESKHEVSTCTGKILSSKSGRCPMREYRFGTNPKRKGIGGKRSPPTLIIKPQQDSFLTIEP